MPDTSNTEAFYPPAGFHFQITFSGFSGDSASFQEVSGISAEMETEEVSEGGENRFAHRVPAAVKYQNLILKRGLMHKGSALTKWCQETIGGGLQEAIQPKNITVNLLDVEGNPVMSWNFINAWPVGWEVSSFAAEGNDLAVESLGFSYDYFF